METRYNLIICLNPCEGLKGPMKWLTYAYVICILLFIDRSYAVCIYENRPGTSYLDLKLGDIIEIEKEMFEQNGHMVIKNGVKGLVTASCVRILTYEKLIAGNLISKIPMYLKILDLLT